MHGHIAYGMSSKKVRPEIKTSQVTGNHFVASTTQNLLRVAFVSHVGYGMRK